MTGDVWRCRLFLCCLAFVTSCGSSAAPRDPDAGSRTGGAAGTGADAGAAGSAASDAGAAGASYVDPPLRPPERSAETRCTLEGTRADALPRLRPEPWLDELRFDRARAVLAAPGDAQALYVVEQHGVVSRVDLASSPASAQVVLDLSTRVTCCEAGGLRGFAFHPAYAQNGFVFAFYVIDSPPRRARVARFVADLDTRMVDPASERVVLDVPLPGMGREGGPLLFDGDGMLLVALGDGGVEPASSGLRAPGGLLSAVLRLDVSAQDSGPSYAVPEDNPFADATDGTPREVLAWGFRDPQHCALDGESGELWCSDRGPTQSELNLVVPGRHHGWPEVEGNVCTATGRLCLDSGHEGPFASYPLFEGQCGIAGGALHAGANEELLGSVVVYGDACTGLLWGAASRGPQARKRGRVGALGAGLRAAGSNAAGDVLVIDEQGRAFRLVLAPDGTPGTFPELLSETGCYADPSRHEPAAEWIEFRVRSPLWSDGTHKRRFLRVPEGARIDAPAHGGWMFPVGTVIMKEFALQFDDADPNSVRPIETRFMLHREDGWEFYSYRWNDAATDAELISEELTQDYTVVRDGEQRTQNYLFPGPDACSTCHASAPGRVLGPRTDQLNFELVYAGEAAPRNQLAALSSAGLFAMPDGPLPVLPDPADETQPIEARARSYLHANCAHCHQPGGWSSPDLLLDLRYELSLSDTHACGERPQFFREGSALIAPGKPDESAILIRMLDTGLDRMPPIATSVVDELGVSVVTRWIESLSSCR